MAGRHWSALDASEFARLGEARFRLVRPGNLFAADIHPSFGPGHPFGVGIYPGLARSPVRGGVLCPRGAGQLVGDGIYPWFG